MKAFLISIVAAIALGGVAALLLNGAQQRVYDAYATSATRVSDPGHNLVGSDWSGDPSARGS